MMKWIHEIHWVGFTRLKSENSLFKKSTPESALCPVSKLLLSSIFRLLELVPMAALAMWLSGNTEVIVVVMISRVRDSQESEIPRFKMIRE